MKSLAFCFALIATCQAFGQTYLYGPDGKQLPAGIYYSVTLSPGKPPTFAVIVNGGVSPNPSPTPQPELLESQVTRWLASVTDPNKAANQTLLGESYAALVKLFDGATDATVFRQAIQISETASLGNSAAHWSAVTDGMRNHTKSVTAKPLMDSYAVAAKVLRGEGPQPPPNPTPPPTPSPATAVKALIILDLQGQTAAQASMLNQMRNDRTLSPLVTVLDTNQKLADKSADPQATKANAAIATAGKTAPAVLGVAADGSFSFVEPLPATWQSLKSLLELRVAPTKSGSARAAELLGDALARKFIRDVRNVYVPPIDVFKVK